ncbi:interleukin-10 receptor subunit alpha [Acanthopagrus schlegelii]
MDVTKGPLIPVFLLICINCVTGQVVPQPTELEVNIMDGEVIVLWKPPADVPSNAKYNVQMARYSGEWEAVDSCTGIENTYCELSRLIEDFQSGYKVRVQLVDGDNVSEWTRKKFLPNESGLTPPSFTLWATASSLTVRVHEKPILRKLFPYGLIYTIYLEERGQDKKNTTLVLTGDVMEEDQRTKTFSSLRYGTEYCVSIMMEGSGSLSASNLSPKQCLRLPEQEWIIIALTSLTILGVLAVMAIAAAILLCYLKSPGKTPAVLKSPVSGWLPLSVGEGTMEVVTDKGWFLSSYRTEVKNCVTNPVTHVTVTEDNEEEDRRTSMDSGVSVESNSATHIEGSPPVRQEDSGCGSMGGPESSTSSQTVYTLQEDTARKRDDSGVGLGCQLHSSSMNLDGQDSVSLKEAVVGGNYRTQGPSSVHIHVCDDEEPFKLPDSVLAEVVTGYRAAVQSCICSGAGQCTWCHKQGLYGIGVMKHYRSMCIDNGLVSGTCDFVDSYKGITYSSYAKKAQMDAVTMAALDTTFIQLGDTFPLLTALTPLPLEDRGQDFNMNNVTLSLCDVQLTTDCGM